MDRGEESEAGQNLVDVYCHAPCSSTVQIWNLENNLIVQTLQRHNGSVNSIFWHGNLLFSGSADKTVKVGLQRRTGDVAAPLRTRAGVVEPGARASVARPRSHVCLLPIPVWPHPRFIGRTRARLSTFRRKQGRQQRWTRRCRRAGAAGACHRCYREGRTGRRRSSARGARRDRRTQRRRHRKTLRSRRPHFWPVETATEAR